MEMDATWRLRNKSAEKLVVEIPFEFARIFTVVLFASGEEILQNISIFCNGHGLDSFSSL